MLTPAHRAHLLDSLLVLALVSATLSSLVPLSARGAEDACPLKTGQKVAAVKAFKRFAAIFQEPRCLNCHGEVNPFSETGRHGGGYIDIRKETREFLNLPGFESFLLAPNSATIGRLREVATSASAVSENDLIRFKAFEPMLRACKQCHIDGWILPMRENHFVGRSPKNMCIHMKMSSDTDSPDRFQQHMQHDALVLAAFAGRRGLLDSAAAQPPVMSFATMTRHANDWIAAMDKQFHQPPDCGCTVDGIILEVDHRIQADPKSDWSRTGMALFDGSVRFDVLLTPVEGATDWFRGDVSVSRPMVVRHVTPSTWRCSGSGSQTEDWRLSAVFHRKTDILRLQFGYVSSDEQASWTCVAPNGMTTTNDLYVDLRRSLNSLEMSAKDGATKEVSSRNAKFLERLSVTIIGGPTTD